MQYVKSFTEQQFATHLNSVMDTLADNTYNQKCVIQQHMTVLNIFQLQEHTGCCKNQREARNYI